MIHAKTMVVDGMFAMIGTSNLDARSSEINEELDIVVYDEKFGREMEATFEKDLNNAGNILWKILKIVPCGNVSPSG